MGMNHFSMMKRRPKPPSETKQSKSSDAAFEIWLERGLHKLFDDITREPIPEELLKLIQEKHEQ